MRVVAGILKGRLLSAPPAGDLRVRPTADRAREALFSILQRWASGPFLDLCAGTGAVAVEAHSRGYSPVACVESGEPGWTCLQRNLNGLPIRSIHKDLRRLHADSFRDQAVIFLDPPYEMASALWVRQSSQLRSWISRSGALVIETDRNTTLEPQPGWMLAELREYGAARFHFWIPA